MKKIEEMLKNAVKIEVMAALEPLEERMNRQEEASEEITRQFSSIMKEVERLKVTASNFPALTGPSSTVSERIVSRGYSRMERAMYCDNDMKANMEGIRDMCAAARKVVGFSPIEPKMLKIQMEGFGAKDLQEAVLMEIKLYLKCEMEMPPSEIEKLEIIRIFPPARDDWNVLYVEFGSDHDVNNIFSYTRRIVNMENKITHWIPRQMYGRYRAVESLAYTIRQDEKLKTRVKIGRDDFLLSIEPSSSVWHYRKLPNTLPQIDLDQLSLSSSEISSSSREGIIY